MPAASVPLPTPEVAPPSPPEPAIAEGASPFHEDDDSYEFAAAGAVGGWGYVYRAPEVEP
jgi:hypothetical protein